MPTDNTVRTSGTEAVTGGRGSERSREPSERELPHCGDRVPAPVVPGPSTRTGRQLTIAALVAASALIATGCSSGAKGAGTPAAAQASPTTAPNSAPAAPKLPSGGTVTATIAAIGPLHDTTNSYGIAADDTDVWVYDGEDGTLSRIATLDNTVVATVKLRPGCQRGRGCGNVAIGAGAVWVANEVDGTITRIDTATNAVATTISVGDGAAPMVYLASGAIWSANYLSRNYSQIDAASNTISATLTDHGGAESVAFGFGSIWLCDAHENRPVTRLDASTLQVQAQIDLSHDGTAYACISDVATDQSILIGAASTVDNSSLIERLDPTTNQVTDANSPPGNEGVGLAATPTQAWTVDAALGLFELDPRTGRPESQLSIPTPAGLAVGAASVWVVSSSGIVSRVTPAD